MDGKALDVEDSAFNMLLDMIFHEEHYLRTYGFVDQGKYVMFPKLTRQQSKKKVVA